LYKMIPLKAEEVPYQLILSHCLNSLDKYIR